VRSPFTDTFRFSLSGSDQRQRYASTRGPNGIVGADLCVRPDVQKEGAHAGAPLQKIVQWRLTDVSREGEGGDIVIEVPGRTESITCYN
jgi:hypothetical protein